MNRIDRLHAILVHLQSKKRVTGQEIADRFGLSLRTVYRDIKALEESGVPIIGEAGFGYSVMEGYRLPPVMFSQEEASALLLSSKLAERLTDQSVRKHLDNALFKIKAVLRSGEKDVIDQLNEAVAVSTYNDVPSENATHLIHLQKALIEERVVCIDYFSPYREHTSERIIEPVGLLYYSSGWHLIAWCRLRGDYRDFRLSRITRLRLCDEPYKRDKRISLQQYMCHFPKAEVTEVTVLFRKEQARYVVDQKYLRGFSSEEVLEDHVRMKFLTGYLDYLARWLLMFTDAVTIEAPEAMKDRMRALVGELQQYR
ncbi:MAG TPA: YafY family protein [Chitinophagaceae bacterium]|jgi:predicted DNA-binding transcriptional regulator YafY|nr:YafY family protein [Chitinophagaceae bacterium]